MLSRKNTANQDKSSNARLTAVSDPCAQTGVWNAARCLGQTIRQEIERPSLPVREE